MKHNNERKQVFNTYKQQKMNEDRENERKLARENEDRLFEFLVAHPGLFHSMRYQKASQVFLSEVKWLKVPERCRRSVFNDALKKHDQNMKESGYQLHEKNQLFITRLIREDEFFKSEVKMTTKWKEIVDLLIKYANENNDTTLASII